MARRKHITRANSFQPSFPRGAFEEGRGAGRGRVLAPGAVERGGDDRGQSDEQPADHQEDDDRRE